MNPVAPFDLAPYYTPLSPPYLPNTFSVEHAFSVLNSKASFGLSGLLVLIAGCGMFSAGGSPSGPMGKVTIQISYGDAPVNEGIVELSPLNTGSGVSGPLNEAGQTTIEMVPVGTYTVTVIPPAEELPDPENPKPVKAYKNIPNKFRNQTSSPLKAEVAAGETSLKFDLKK